MARGAVQLAAAPSCFAELAQRLGHAELIAAITAGSEDLLTQGRGLIEVSALHRIGAHAHQGA
jgi:hypothetical protein